jgi:hypothetical protein
LPDSLVSKIKLFGKGRNAPLRNFGGGTNVSPDVTWITVGGGERVKMGPVQLQVGQPHDAGTCSLSWPSGRLNNARMPSCGTGIMVLGTGALHKKKGELVGDQMLMAAAQFSERYVPGFEHRASVRRQTLTGDHA